MDRIGGALDEDTKRLIDKIQKIKKVDNEQNQLEKKLRAIEVGIKKQPKNWPP